MKTNKQNLLHEGLLELIVLAIKARNKIHELKKDKELELWENSLDTFQTDLNEVMAELGEMLGCAAGNRIEVSEESR